MIQHPTIKLQNYIRIAGGSDLFPIGRIDVFPQNPGKGWALDTPVARRLAMKRIEERT